MAVYGGPVACHRGLADSVAGVQSPSALDNGLLKETVVVLNTGRGRAHEDNFL